MRCWAALYGIVLNASAFIGTLPGVWNDLSSQILSLSNQARGLYNGNIALMVTDLPDQGNVTGTGFIKEGSANAYQYDQLNRLKQMRSNVYKFGSGWQPKITGAGPGY